LMLWLRCVLQVCVLTLQQVNVSTSLLINCHQY
jgi:hypothetical protein